MMLYYLLQSHKDDAYTFIYNKESFLYLVVFLFFERRYYKREGKNRKRREKKNGFSLISSNSVLDWSIKLRT